ncbi:type IV pilin N-terminal domain-containing protein [Methanolacinia paynteri]|uniref:type IV pilin N-terminal domain-containing protein n=1 Tax=Methanolacinia paynteri TaxID=230356 RepID=UPI00064E1616|nr:type IV pilin N-terminal domain-containing protein [Methanolacinia paynteri]
MKKMIKSSEDAVSPVVGVMLMLVVTIILAAVVSAFAGGMGGDMEKAPQAVLDVEIKYADMGMNVGIDSSNFGYITSFEQVSGEPIPTKDLEIITYYTNISGDTYKHEQSPSSDTYDIYTGSPLYEGYGITRVPYLNDLSVGWASNEKVWFGNFVLTTGDIMTAGTTQATAELLGIGDGSGGIADPDFGVGSIVDVKIKHVPSGNFIYNKEVIVQ